MSAAHKVGAFFRPCERFYTDLDHNLADCVICHMRNPKRPWGPKRSSKSKRRKS